MTGLGKRFVAFAFGLGVGLVAATSSAQSLDVRTLVDFTKPADPGIVGVFIPDEPNVSVEVGELQTGIFVPDDPDEDVVEVVGEEGDPIVVSLKDKCDDDEDGPEGPETGGTDCTNTTTPTTGDGSRYTENGDGTYTDHQDETNTSYDRAPHVPTYHPEVDEPARGNPYDQGDEENGPGGNGASFPGSTGGPPSAEECADSVICCLDNGYYWDPVNRWCSATCESSCVREYFEKEEASLKRRNDECYPDMQTEAEYWVAQGKRPPSASNTHPLVEKRDVAESCAPSPRVPDTRVTTLPHPYRDPHTAECVHRGPTPEWVRAAGLHSNGIKTFNRSYCRREVRIENGQTQWCYVMTLYPMDWVAGFMEDRFVIDFGMGSSIESMYISEKEFGRSTRKRFRALEPKIVANITGKIVSGLKTFCDDSHDKRKREFDTEIASCEERCP